MAITPIDSVNGMVELEDSREIFDEVFGMNGIASFQTFSERLLEYSRRSGRSFVVHNSKKFGKIERNVGRRTKKGEKREVRTEIVEPTSDAKYYWVNYRCQHHGRGERHTGRTTR